MAKKKLRFPKKDRLGHLKRDGSENVSSKPTELRAKINNPVSLREKMKQMWSEFRENEDRNNQFESNEDAQDFNVSNDEFPSSPYEISDELHDQIAQDAANIALQKINQTKEQVNPAEEKNDDQIFEQVIQEQKD